MASTLMRRALAMWSSSVTNGSEARRSAYARAAAKSPAVRLISDAMA